MTKCDPNAIIACLVPIKNCVPYTTKSSAPSTNKNQVWSPKA